MLSTKRTLPVFHGLPFMIRQRLINMIYFACFSTKRGMHVSMIFERSWFTFATNSGHGNTFVGMTF